MYVLWSHDRKRAYVGEALNLRQRLMTHAAAIRLGASVEVYYLPANWRYPAGPSRWRRIDAEKALAERLRADGVEVVSNHGHFAERRPKSLPERPPEVSFTA